MTEMRTNTRALLPVMLSFFVMGFVDITGIAVSYVKTDFGLSDTVSNLIPMMVFLWFAILSIPVGKLMGKIGRRKTVIFSAALTVAAMLIPAFSYSFGVMLAAFAMLGIANTVLQVSLNPLVTDVVPQGKVTGSLALGQFIKAISSTLAPVLAGAAAAVSGSWKTVFFAYAAVAAVSAFDNARINKVSRHVETYCGDASLLQAGKYDVLLANINRNILIQDIPTYARSLRKGGMLFISGFYVEDMPMIQGVAENSGLQYATHDSMDGWCCIKFVKS